VKRWFRNLILRLTGTQFQIDELKREYYELEDLVFSTAKFADSKGVADANYNSKEVEERWHKFHTLNGSIQNRLRGLK